MALLQNHRRASLFLIILVVGAQAANIAVPFIMRTLIDTLSHTIQNGQPLPLSTLVYTALGILLATVIGSALQSSYNYHLFKLVTGIEDKIRNMAFEKYLQLQALFHHGSSSGQVIGRIERGSTAIYIILNDIIGQYLLPPLIVFLGAFIVLLYQNIWIALAVLIPFPIYFLITRSLSNHVYVIEQKVNDAFENVSREAYDVAGNVLTVKKFSQEVAETDHQRKLMAGGRKIQYSGERLWGIIENIQTAIATVGRVAVLGLSGWFVLRGEATVGQFVLYVTLQNMAYQPLSQLSSMFTRLRRNATRVERLFTILDEPITVLDSPQAINLPPLSDQININNVSFSYRDKKTSEGSHKVSKQDRTGWALRNINLTIEAGSTIALVGRSGSGKTTFINLLMRSFDPQKGCIYFDGRDIREVRQASLRAQIAVVPQEVDLFSRSVAENIAYGKPRITKKQIEEAAKIALAHDFILKLEDGYDTVVGERGIKLSGGERQRIGIARAVLRNPSILILDEATSNLDTESEQLISQATNALIKNRTSLIIAHRLSTVLHADKIVVFKDNHIEAVGTHSALLHESPTYQKLYGLQFKDGKEDSN